MAEKLNRPDRGFTLAELLVALVVGSLVMTAVYRLWSANQRETALLQSKGDFRDRATLAITALNKSITMAGFGISKMNVINLSAGPTTDTLILYSNTQERRTTLRDTARMNARQILVFTDSGFSVGGMIGITDSLQQEYVGITSISGDTAHGFQLGLAQGLSHKYIPGVPDVYPVQKEIFYFDQAQGALVEILNGGQIILAAGMTDFRVDMRDASGNSASTSQNLRMVTFSLTGSYKAPAGVPSQMRFSSTVLPRNIL